MEADLWNEIILSKNSRAYSRIPAVSCLILPYTTDVMYNFCTKFASIPFHHYHPAYYTSHWYRPPFTMTEFGQYSSWYISKNSEVPIHDPVLERQ